MMTDPYKVLGIPSTATDDEVKQAYRRLAKRYHPDANPGDQNAERRMQEINAAYDEIMNRRTNPNAGRSTGYDPFGGFDPFGCGGFGGYQQRQQQTYSSPEMQAARNYVRFGHYQEAQNLLRTVTNRTAEWYFVSAQAEYGLGNKANALDFAQRACQMDPDNFEFRRFLSQLESGSQAYRSAGQGYGFGSMPAILCQNPFLACCLLNTLCSCCCGGRFYCC